MTHKQLTLYSPVVLRLGLVAVVIWFGVSQLMNSAQWVGVVPVWAKSLSGMSALSIIRFNGCFEILTGALLAIGLWTRWVALALAVHLFIIATGFGISPIGVRDFGLSVSLLAVAMFGSDVCSFEHVHEDSK